MPLPHHILTIVILQRLQQKAATGNGLPATLLYPIAYLAHRSYWTFPRNIQSLSFLKVK